MYRDCFQAIKSLHSNIDILIIKPDEGSVVVILNNSDYVEKMKTILNSGNKFSRLGPVEDYDNAMKIESKLQKRLLQLRKVDQLTRLESNDIRLTGSQKPIIYGLPKTHKPSVPLRSISSIIGSSQYELAKWFSELL